MFIFAIIDRVDLMHGDMGYLSETLARGKYFQQEGSHTSSFDLSSVAFQDNISVQEGYKHF